MLWSHFVIFDKNRMAWDNNDNTSNFKNVTAQKMKFSIMDFFSKCYQIHSSLRIWSHLLKKSAVQNFIFCAVNKTLAACIWDHYQKDK